LRDSDEIFTISSAYNATLVCSIWSLLLAAGGATTE